MYKRTTWQDHVTQYQDRFREVQNSDGTLTHEPIEGEVIQQGTPQNAANFNNIEDGIMCGIETAALLTLGMNHLKQSVASLKGEVISTTLTNSYQYPFNNSKKTLSLSVKRNSLDYTVEVEAVAVGTGFVGEIIVSDKQLNGFKVEHTGSAKNVSLKCYVKGGIY